MADREPEYAPFDPSMLLDQGLDTLLAVLLLSKRLHVEDFSLAGSRHAKIEVSGEAIEYGLASLVQILTLMPPDGGGRERSEQQETAAGTSFWQSLKDFVLPPIKPPHKR